EVDDYALIVVMTAYPEVRTAVTALKAGAYDYLNKPFDIDDLKGLVQRALETQQLRTEVERLRVATPGPGPVSGMIGGSPAFLSLVEMMRRIAGASRVSVMIRGESGTGKERIAQAIHANSPRSGGPWITVNCSAISEGLLESEMFGHEKGAFTDAKARKRGLLELADGGTLFLDEIGELSPQVQVKLLRFLQEHEFQRLGGNQTLRTDVRVISATNRNLEQRVREGAFREDLFYRLNVVLMSIPPLRERKEDIPILIDHFLNRYAEENGKEIAGLSSEAQDVLLKYDYPGNVRELENIIERAVVIAREAVISVEDLPFRESMEETTAGRKTEEGLLRGS
ncbi:MAG: sigma-54 dependent transcriptional regulator, partial [Syntrophales bacterium]|nr:sigma-54 dependent transcriptional regulator [Syntrophales bacterium]